MTCCFLPAEPGHKGADQKGVRPLAAREFITPKLLKYKIPVLIDG
jgi:hypothetical protein